jgi:hypothetical protein
MHSRLAFVARSFVVVGSLVSCAFVGCVSRAQTLHVISVADTNDPQSGVEFNINNDEITRYVKSLAATANLKLDQINITGKSYSCDSIEAAIKKLSVKSEDAIIFFHSGHGNSPKQDANDKKASNFPSLECTISPSDPGLNLEDIANELKATGAALTVVGADSCNKILSGAAQPRVVHGLVPANAARTMFRNYRGYVLISSSSPNEDSFYPNKSVGFFTKQLIDTLNNPPAVQPQNLWKEVIAKAALAIDVPTPQKKQHPLHVEDLQYVP